MGSDEAFAMSLARDRISQVNAGAAAATVFGCHSHSLQFISGKSGTYSPQ